MSDEKCFVKVSEATESKKEMAYLLWLEWFAEYDQPIRANEWGDLYCFFCSCDVSSFEYFEGNISHDPSCIYIRAKALVQKSKEEN